MKSKAFDLITFGEIMLRLSPSRNERLVRGDSFEKRAGGSELNVASGVSLLGLRTAVLSKLPSHAMGQFIRNRTRFMGVSDDCLIYDDARDARLGVYYYENGAAPRKPAIVYDRIGSSFAGFSLEDVPAEAYGNTKIFHTSGISLGLNQNMQHVTTEMIKKFKESGAQISFDVNFRANLWDEETAHKVIEKVLPYIDILFISEETCRRMFQKEGDLKDIQKSFAQEYGCKIVATTRRKVNSPKSHDFGSMIYYAETDTYYDEEDYKDIDVVDRVGSGDAYCSGVLFGLLNYNDPFKALQFGNATSAMKNTIPGDLPSSDFAEIEGIIANHNATGPVGEMNR